MPGPFLLVHSPLVGPLTWRPVAAELANRGQGCVVPAIETPLESREPLWRQHVRQVVELVAESNPAPVLVGHSGAGPLLPAIFDGLRGAVAASILVDADLPTDGSSRFELFESQEQVEQFRRTARDGLLPPWSEEALQPQIEDDELRLRFCEELSPRPLRLYEERLPVPGAWEVSPRGYLLFSESYRGSFEEAEKQHWPTRKLPGSHFHMLNRPAEVAEALIALASELTRE